MTATLHDADLGVPPARPPELPEQYRLGELVGIGGTASVYRATDRRSGAEVAVKVLHSTSDTVTAARFAAEARLLGELRHPGLAEIVDAGRTGCRPYLVTRFVDGETLQTTLGCGAMSLDAVVGLGAGLATTLAHVHARGIVHRDVKPANILLDRDGRPFLTDFGVSRLVEATHMTETGATVGTPAYMAPEQVRGTPVGPAADVYALGLVLLEALTGHREYPGGPIESAVARLHRRPLVPATVPGPVRALLREMTADDPGRRPTATRVAARLAARDEPRALHRARRGAWALVAALALGGTTLGLAWASDPSEVAAATVADAPAPERVAPALASPEPAAAPTAPPPSAAVAVDVTGRSGSAPTPVTPPRTGTDDATAAGGDQGEAAKPAKAEKANKGKAKGHGEAKHGAS